MSGSRDDLVRDGLKPWWRSVGFWLGLWGLVFLGWVWVGSFSRGWEMMRYVRATAAGGGMTGYIEWLVNVQDGRVVYHVDEPAYVAPGIVCRADWPGLRRASVKSGLYGGGESRWGVKSWSGGTVVDGGSVMMSYRFIQRWFPFAWVVAGYGVMWLGGLVICRWWLRRRWEASRVVEG